MTVTIPNPLVMTYEEFMHLTPREVQEVCFNGIPLEETVRFVLLYHVPKKPRALHVVDVWARVSDSVGQEVAILPLTR